MATTEEGIATQGGVGLKMPADLVGLLLHEWN